MSVCRLATAASEVDLVYGACAPGRDPEAPTVDDWIDVVRSRGIRRVCCLLSDRQLADFDGLLGRYRDAFGADAVRHAPVEDHTLIDRATLTEAVLPFVRAAVDADEAVVVHCLAGVGRTGQVLAAWLVAAHDYDPVEAIETVSERHRQPDDAVRTGNATHEELVGLLGSVAP